MCPALERVEGALEFGALFDEARGAVRVQPLHIGRLRGVEPQGRILVDGRLAREPYQHCCKDPCGRSKDRVALGFGAQITVDSSQEQQRRVILRIL